jgi:formyltetrahydrofolate-dependent phosphoribosylglycinamide formyltransferase
MQVIVYTDGGSRGNPGLAAAGYVISDVSGRRLQARGVLLGETTNNVAEYTAVIRALEAARTLGADQVTVYSDSQLLVRQLDGRYKVKSTTIRPLFDEARSLLSQFSGWAVRHVTRDKNTEADRLVNQALDAGHDVEATGSEGRASGASVRTGGRQRHLRLGVLISGSGRTMLNILEQIRGGRLNAEVPLAISSRSTVAGVERARDAGLPVTVVRTKDFGDVESFSGRLVEELDAARVDLVVQGGWLCLWRIPPRYENRVMNIHPALLPSFGGRGMWGHHVHEAVLAAGCKVSGCTVHFCTNEYDKGPIIVQRTCPVADDDTADTLAARVFEQECLAYPQAIQWFAEDRLRVEGNRVRVLP